LWDDVHHNSLETPTLDRLRRLWNEVYDEPHLIVEQQPLVVEIPPLVPVEVHGIDDDPVSSEPPVSAELHGIDDDPVSSELPIQNDSDLVPVDLPVVPPAESTTEAEVIRFWNIINQNNMNQNDLNLIIYQIIDILD